MRRIVAYLFCALLLSAVACKPTEKNYKASYDKAMTGRAEAINEDSTIYNAVRREMDSREIEYKGKSYPLKSQFVSITKDGGGVSADIKKYCVVAGQFKQSFNAKMMRERMAENGYPGTFVVNTREPYYFVVAGAYADIEPAIELYNKLAKDADLKIKSPLPFLLWPSQIR